MTQTRIHSFNELHEVFSKYRNDSIWVFRGHSHADWPLIPKVGRTPFLHCDDVESFYSWKRRAKEFLPTVDNDWDFLSIAQHYGLATRLLDWTYNPLIATFFAVQLFAECDAVVFALRYPHDSTPEHYETPFEVKGIKKFKPNASAKRITSQSGVFTIHNPTHLDLEKHLDKGERLEKIIIDKRYRKELRFELNHYGVNDLTLFPDLEGLSKHINFHMENKIFWQTD